MRQAGRQAGMQRIRQAGSDLVGDLLDQRLLLVSWLVRWLSLGDSTTSHFKSFSRPIFNSLTYSFPHLSIRVFACSSGGGRWIGRSVGRSVGRRLRYLWRGMHVYRELRVCWLIFQRWLKLMENHLQYQTPGLKQKVASLRKRAGRLSALLDRRGVAKATYVPYTQSKQTNQP